MTPMLKHTVRKMIREAIRYDNKQVLFTCHQCCFYIPPHEKTSRPAKCDLDESNTLLLVKRMPTQLPECFTYNPLASAFSGVLTLMYSLGVDTIRAEQGWATIVSRLAARADRFGYIMGVTQKNLDKYGSTE
ncbi:hypothetical protein KAR91_40425 [Candidatus Pacearchaeota archaeon]|nr:hypothetical protein [Candidatus Pacearchaeota archaeon]